MSKKHFIALADKIREHNKYSQWEGSDTPIFTDNHLRLLADFCREQNCNFNRERWLGYIAGENGKNGGKVAA